MNNNKNKDKSRSSATYENVDSKNEYEYVDTTPNYTEVIPEEAEGEYTSLQICTNEAKQAGSRVETTKSHPASHKDVLIYKVITVVAVCVAVLTVAICIAVTTSIINQYTCEDPVIDFKGHNQTENQCNDSKGGVFGMESRDNHSSYWKYGPSDMPFLQQGSINKYVIRLQFNTTSSEGLLFFAASIDKTRDPAIKNDYIGAYIHKGNVVYSMLPHSKFGPAKVTSKLKYNDGELHSAMFYQRGDKIFLCVNDQCTAGETKRATSTGTVELDGNLFLGGVPQNISDKAQSRLDRQKITGFTGCIKNIMVDGQSTAPPVVKINTKTNCNC